MNYSSEPLSYKTAKKVVLALGFVFRGCVGSHEQYKHPTSGKKVTLPFYKKHYHPDLEHSIAKQAGISVQRFRELATNKQRRKAAKKLQ